LSGSKENQAAMQELRSVDMLAEVLKTAQFSADPETHGEYEPPQGEMEEKLTSAWAEALQRSRVGRHDDFFALGGDSIAAVQLMMRLQDFIPGEMIPLRAILEAPTVAEFAAWLKNNDGNDQQILVQIKRGSSARPAFFCVHAPDGTAIGMQPLAKEMADDLPFYCLQGKGLDGSEPYKSVEEAAEHCLAEIRKVQPNGPYYLGGFCFGGFVAYEMACTLQRLGEQVPLLVIIDGFNPAYLRGKTTAKMLVSLVGFYFRRMAMHARKMRTLGPAGSFDYMSGRFRAIFVHAGRFRRRLGEVKARQNFSISDLPVVNETETGNPARYNEILLRLEPLGRALASKWTPKPYSGDALVFRVSERSDDPYEDYFLGWRRLVKGHLESYEIEATHETIMNEPAVRICAERIDAELLGKSPRR
jgi:thioesterase domain-containing protein